MSNEYFITKINVRGYEKQDDEKFETEQKTKQKIEQKTTMIDRASIHGYYRTDGTFVRPSYCAKPRP